MNDLLTEARGDSVSEEKLAGDERYYPDASYIFTGDPPLIEEQPHYIILLTASNNIIKGTPSVSPDEMGVEIKTNHGSLIVTDESIVAVGDSIGAIITSGERGFYRFGYEDIDSIGGIGLLNGGSVEITVGGIEFNFDLAGTHGDAQNIREAHNYIQTRL